MAANATASILYRKIYNMLHSICRHSLFFAHAHAPARLSGLDRKSIDKPQPSLFPLAISCCQPTSQRSHTILPTTQPKMATAIFGFGLTRPLPISRRGSTGKIPLSEKISGIDRTNIVNRTVCWKAATIYNEGLAQWRHYLAWTIFAIFAGGCSR